MSGFLLDTNHLSSVREPTRRLGSELTLNANGAGSATACRRSVNWKSEFSKFAPY